jgi:hypothetical protein
MAESTSIIGYQQAALVYEYNIIISWVGLQV